MDSGRLKKMKWSAQMTLSSGLGIAYQNFIATNKKFMSNLDLSLNTFCALPSGARQHQIASCQLYNLHP